MSSNKNTEAAIAEKNEGNKYFLIKDYKKAIYHYTLAIEKYDDTLAALYSNRAACYLKLGEYQKALIDCDKAIELQNNYGKAILRRGVAKFHLGKWVESLEDFRTHEMISDEDGKLESRLYYIVISEELRNRSDYESPIARSEVERKVCFSMRKQKLKKNKIGIEFMKHNRNILALEFFKRSLNLNPNSVKALCNRAECFIKCKKLPKALDDANKAISLDPKNDEAYVCRGTIYLHMKSYQKAVNDLSCAQKLNPKNEEINEKLKTARKALIDSIEMPSRENVNKLKENKEIMSKLNDPQIQKILKDIKNDSNLIKGYLQQPEIRKLLLQIMDIIDPSFIDKLKEEEEKL